MNHTLALPVSTQVSIPEATVLMQLSERYFEHSDFFSPILDRGEMAQLSDAARSDEDPRSKFVCIKESVDSCANVLWGTAERGPHSRSEDYRDRFDGLILQLTDPKPLYSAGIYSLLEPRLSTTPDVPSAQVCAFVAL